MTAKTPVKGHASKHVHKQKKHHKAKGKHHPSHVTNPVPQFRPVPPHVAGKPATHPKPRGFAVGDLLPVCAFEAVAQSLRLAGQRVSDDDLLGLWDAAGRREVPIAEALAAAALFGLAGCCPQSLQAGPNFVGFQPEVAQLDSFAGVGVADLGGRDALDPVIPELIGHGLILGVDVPGPHAVLATPDGWWSWGELHDPWPCQIEEAWAVSWS